MSIFYTRLRAAIRAQGGMFNAHLHLDRAGTLDEQYLYAPISTLKSSPSMDSAFTR